MNPELLELSREELAQLYQDTMDNFDAMEAEELYDPEDLDQLRANTFEEYQTLLANAEGFVSEDEYDDEDEYEDYSAYNEAYANFQVGSDFGSALVELIDQEYAGNEEEGILAVCESTGITPEELAALVTGDLEPTEEFIYALTDVFNSVKDEDAYQGLQILGAVARGEDLEDYEDDEDEVIEADYRVAELEDQVANFQVESALKDGIAELEYQARQLVDSGCMTPYEAEVMFGNFELDSNRIAAFSAMCNEKTVDPAIELYAMQYHLDLCEKRGSIANFSQFVDEPTQEEISEEVAYTRQAKHNMADRFDKILKNII